jgi:hypothetical protein
MEMEQPECDLKKTNRLIFFQPKIVMRAKPSLPVREATASSDLKLRMTYSRDILQHRIKRIAYASIKKGMGTRDSRLGCGSLQLFGIIVFIATAATADSVSV